MVHTIPRIALIKNMHQSMSRNWENSSSMLQSLLKYFISIEIEISAMVLFVSIIIMFFSDGEMDDDGFFMGEINGRRGLVPSNFLTDVPSGYIFMDQNQQGSSAFPYSTQSNRSQPSSNQQPRILGTQRRWWIYKNWDPLLTNDKVKYSPVWIYTRFLNTDFWPRMHTRGLIGRNWS